MMLGMYHLIGDP